VLEKNKNVGLRSGSAEHVG